MAFARLIRVEAIFITLVDTEDKLGKHIFNFIAVKLFTHVP